MQAAYLSYFEGGKTFYGVCKNVFYLLLLIIVMFPGIGQTQNQIVTEHFNIYYESGTKETARRVADVAEEVFAPLTSAFNAYDNFSRVHIFVHDDIDFSNGFATYYQNKIEIWATELDFELRGTHNWIKNVLTHELSHIISLNVASRGFFNLGILNFGRFNVNPDFSFNLPYYHLVTPSWFVEGIAQFKTGHIGHDEWDTHRDMLLRMAVLEEDLLSYDEMGVFSGDGLHREMVYNQGYAILHYIEEKYGSGKVEALTRNTGLISFNKAIKKVLGISPAELYNNWKQDLLNRYTKQRTQIASIVSKAPEIRLAQANNNLEPYLQNGTSSQVASFRNNVIEGELVIDGGYLDYFPTLSPDGKKIAYISNEGSDFAITRLKVYDMTTGTVEDLKENVRSRISWTPDGKQLVYVRRKENFNDLFIYNLDTRKERRISLNLRAKDPAVSPDGKTIAFIRNNDGTTNLGLINVNGTQVRYFTNYNDGTQYYSPVWSPDGSQIAFSIFRGEDRDIGIIHSNNPTFSKTVDAPDSVAFSDSSFFEILIHTNADERDPHWLPDGSGLVFSSDRDGIFNLYEYTFATKKIHKRSVVLGGAFTPSTTPDGRTIIYAGYHAANYSIFRLARDAYYEPISMEPIERDYHSIYTGEPLGNLYSVARTSKKFSVINAVPILSLSPSFVGNRFTINTINAGLQFTIGDLWGTDHFVGTGIVGKTITRNLDLNYSLSGYYERRLAPILTQDKTLAPTGYGFINKQVINDINDFALSARDTSVGTLLRPEGETIDTLENAQRFRLQSLAGNDKSRFDFTSWGTGFRLPLSRTQIFSFQFRHKAYHWSIIRNAVFIDSLRYFWESEEIILPNSVDQQDISSLLVDTEFYSSNDVILSWNYANLKPTVDAAINPAGGRRIRVGYARLNSTITDSLLFISSFFRMPGEPANIPSKRKLPINEYSFNWQEFISLPMNRHTLSFETLIIYRDQRLREFSELTNFDGFFPLRLYLGGQGTMRGYPYFTLTGSKLFFSRLNYTFPIFQNIGKQIFHLYLDRLYGSVFFETGTTWNFDKFSFDNIKRRGLLYDAGLELRLSLFSFYRLPGTAFFQIAWPLRNIPEHGIDISDPRIYFGLNLGGMY